MSTPHCQFAKQVFTTYFKWVADAAGLEWDAANGAEVERAIDEIYAEAVMAAKREVFSHLQRESAPRAESGSFVP